jgi:hypothetical protein
LTQAKADLLDEDFEPLTDDEILDAEAYNFDTEVYDPAEFLLGVAETCEVRLALAAQ